MKHIILLYGLLISLAACRQNDCPDGINNLPMYGQVEKCNEQLESDKEFLKECDKQFNSRKKPLNSMLIKVGNTLT